MSPQNPPPKHRGWYSRGDHPHCDVPGLIQSIGFRLFDSVPEDLIERWRKELELDNLKESTQREKLTRQIDTYADRGCGCCFLADRRIAALVENAILFFDSQRYDVLAWCVMSNHVHALIATTTGFPLSQIMHSWKSYTAHAANKLLNRQGQFWSPDFFDQFMRTTQQLEDTIQYIEFNPVTAGMVEHPSKWPFSSAAERHAIRVRSNRALYPEIVDANLPDI